MTNLNSLSIRFKPLLQVAVELFAIYFYIWFLQKHAPFYIHVPFFWGFCVAFPILCIAFDQREFPEFSLDWDEFAACARGLVWFTVLASAALLGLAFYFKTLSYDGNFAGRMVEYLFWAFLQQVALQIFFTRRMQKVFRNIYAVAFVSATVFALIHFPNPVLVGLTWIGGFFWCLSFQLRPNLYALALSHAWLAVLTLYCMPQSWLHQLRIGPDYWTYMPPLP